MADIIALLPDHVANQIAAGEVVQRPASVVKELLENAIDAGANHIKLVVKDAGKTLIQVIDNGKGMSTKDAVACFSRHATSKIKQADDLFALNTKGFRGEALASIAAIAQVDLKTRQASQDLGTQVQIAGSEINSQNPSVTPVGTVVSVKNLFYNIPARRNFLKSNPVESRHIIDEFQRVALAHPDIAFDFTNNNAMLFTLPKANLKQRIVAVFGAKTKERLVPVKEETDVVKVNGFVIKPQFAKKSRGEQFFFVNNRFIKSSYLNHAVGAAFEGLLKPNANAGYFLFLEVDPNSIDINIHPTKTEIKFDNDHAIYAMLRATIKHALGQFSVAPVLDFNRDASLDTPYNYSQKSPKAPVVEVDPNFNPFAKESKGNSYGSSFTKPQPAKWESLYSGLKDTQESDAAVHSFETFESEENTGLFKQEDSYADCFQIQAKFIASPIKSGLLLLHQQRAHERILYESFLAKMTLEQGISQQLLFPVTLKPTPNEVAVLTEVRDALEQLGFVFDSFDTNGISCIGVPVQTSADQVSTLFEQILTDLINQVPDASFSQNDVLAKSMAKSLAIKTGTQLDVQEQKHIIHQLFGCKEPTVSPFNKTTFKTLAVNQLEKGF